MSIHLIQPGSDAVTECRNLRLDRNGTASALGAAHTISHDFGSWQLIGTVSTPDGLQVPMLADGNRLGWMPEDVPIAIADLGSRVLCCVGVQGEPAVVMTEHCAWQIEIPADIDAVPRVSKRSDTIDTGIAFGSILDSTTTMQIAPVGLASRYGAWGPSLTARDAAQFTQAALEGYRSLCDYQSARGAFVQPVAVRYKLLDAAGKVVHTSTPVVVSLDSGWQCMDACDITLYRESDGAFAISQRGYLTLQTFRLRLRLPGAAYAQLVPGVAAVEVFACPALHPVDLKGSSEYRLVGGSGNEAHIHLWLPGAASDHSPRKAHFSTALARLASMMDDGEVSLGAYADPYSGEERDVIVAAPLREGIASTEAEVLLGRYATPREAASGLTPSVETLLAPPNSFVARSVSISGDNIVWGDLVARRHGGVSLDALTVDHTGQSAADEQLLEASAKVTFADGTTITHTSAPCFATMRLSPLICYPDGSARRIEIRAKQPDGTLATATFMLKPLSNTLAAWVDPALEPPRLTASTQTYTPYAYVGAELDALSRELPGWCATARTVDPLTIIAAAPVSCARVMALTPAWGAGSSWDFARGRFYAFATDGIYSLSLGASGNQLKASMIDNRRCDSRRCAALTPEGVVAVAAGALVRLSGTRATTLLYDNADGGVNLAGVSEVTLEPRHGEVWLLRGSNVAECLVWSLQHRGYYHRTLPDDHGVTSTLTIGTRLIGVSAGKLINLSDEAHTLSPTVQIEWTGKVKNAAYASMLKTLKGRAMVPRETMALPRVRLDVTGEATWLDISITDGHSRPVTLLTWQSPGLATTHVNGCLLSVLVTSVRLRHLNEATIRVRGTVAPGFKLRGIRLD